MNWRERVLGGCRLQPRHAVADGQNSPLAAVLETRDGKVFVKGMPSGHRLVITQAREAAAAPLVKGISPALLFSFDEAGWNVKTRARGDWAGAAGLVRGAAGKIKFQSTGFREAGHA